MNILFLTRGYPSTKYVTHGIFEYDMAKGLAKLGHNITYFAVDSRSLRRWRKWGHESLRRDGIQIEAVNIPIGRVYNPLKTYLSERAMISRFNDLEKDLGPFDVIHAHFIESAYLGAKLKEHSGIPLVVTEHSSRLKGKLDDYTKEKLTFAYNYADKVTTVSQSLSDILYSKFNVKSEVIPNIVDTAIFKLKESETEGIESFDFASTGNLIPGKGMDITIRAFSKIAELNPHSNLFIFGQGSEKDNLMNLVEELELTQRVKFLGLVKREVLREYYRKCKVFVLASYGETFGVAYIEAMAMGLPVIATDCGGPSEYVNSGNGLIIPVGDEDRLVEAMLKIIENYAQYDGMKISQDITKKYSELTNAKTLEGIYKEVRP